MSGAGAGEQQGRSKKFPHDYCTTSPGMSLAATWTADVWTYPAFAHILVLHMCVGAGFLSSPLSLAQRKHLSFPDLAQAPASMPLSLQCLPPRNLLCSSPSSLPLKGGKWRQQCQVKTVAQRNTLKMGHCVPPLKPQAYKGHAYLTPTSTIPLCQQKPGRGRGPELCQGRRVFVLKDGFAVSPG